MGAVAPNRLEQHFTADGPDQTGGLTDIGTEEDWLYCEVVLWLCSRPVVGGTIAEPTAATRVCDALIMALGRDRVSRVSLSSRIEVATMALPSSKIVSLNTNAFLVLGRKATAMSMPLSNTGTPVLKSKRLTVHAF